MQVALSFVASFIGRCLRYKGMSNVDKEEKEERVNERLGHLN